jgi:ribosomal protein L7/L12
VSLEQRTAIPTAAILALQEGNKIQAIKLTRQALGLGLKESVLAVDRYLAANPALKSQFDATYRQQRRKAGSWITLAWLALIALLAWWILKDR